MQDPRFNQDPYRCRVEWGRRAAHDAAVRGDIVVIVDVLRFSSAVVTAVHHGAEAYAMGTKHEAIELASQTGAVVLPRDASDPHMTTLSPRTYLGVGRGERVVIASINGGRCAQLAAEAPFVFAGAMLNAGAIADAVALILNARPDLCLTIVPCGERWHEPHEEGHLRFAVEDYLAAGAILVELPHEKSPEAAVCAAAFLRSEGDTFSTLRECASGRELRSAGLDADVRDCAQLNLYDTAPVLRKRRFARWDRSMLD